jgi:type II secretory pathway pseudopilin PulG
MTGRTRSPRRAFTLIEMVISTGLLVMLIGTMYWFYASSLQNREEGTQKARDVQLARVILNRIAEEIRQASGNTPGYGPGIIGGPNALSINTLTMPTKELLRRRSITAKPLAAQFDLNEVRYYIAWDEENLDEDGNPRPLGLVRRVTKTFNRVLILEGEEGTDETAAIKEELYAPELKFIEFRYFDGATWWDRWEEFAGNSLPQMIRITVGYEAVLPEEFQQMELVDDNFLQDESEQEALPPDRYTTFVRLVQADVFYGSRVTREASAFAESEQGIGIQ